MKVLSIAISALLSVVCCDSVNADPDYKSNWRKISTGNCKICHETPSLKVSNGDIVKLKFKGAEDHNVEEFANVRAYKNCDFLDATPVCDTAGADTACKIPTTTNGVYYFGSSLLGDCEPEDGGMKFAMVVNNRI